MFVVLCAAVLALVLWVLSGYFVTMPLGLIYGWSGHPSIPAAPGIVYVIVYLIVLPVAAGAIAWRLLRRLARDNRIHDRGRASSALQ